MSGNKVIYIYIQGKDPNFPDELSDDYWISGHTGMIAMQLSKRYNTIVFESWRIDKTARKYKNKKAFGVFCKVFPCITIPFWGPISLKIFQHINAERKKNNIIIHVSSAGNVIFYLMQLLFRNIPFVYSQMGEKLWCLNKQKNDSVKKRLKRYFQDRFLKSLNHHFVASREIYNGLINLGIENDKISFPEIGTDINMFYPMDKNEARLKLNLPIDSKIVLYIGKFIEGRGVDAILASIAELSHILPSLLIVMVGGNEGDKYWDEVRNKGLIRVWGHTKYELLPLFHNAADISIRVDFSDEGPISVGTNVFESLCCNTPVVSTGLSHLLNKDINKLGIIPKNIKEVPHAIIEILENPTRYQDCAQEIVGLYAWDSVCFEHMKVYQNLQNKLKK